MMYIQRPYKPTVQLPASAGVATVSMAKTIGMGLG